MTLNPAVRLGRYLWIAESVDQRREEGGDFDQQDGERRHDRVRGQEVESSGVCDVVDLQKVVLAMVKRQWPIL